MAYCQESVSAAITDMERRYPYGEPEDLVRQAWAHENWLAEWMVGRSCLVVDGDGRPFGEGRVVTVMSWTGGVVTVGVELRRCRRKHWRRLTIHFWPHRVLCEVGD